MDIRSRAQTWVHVELPSRWPSALVWWAMFQTCIGDSPSRWVTQREIDQHYWVLAENCVIPCIYSLFVLLVSCTLSHRHAGQKENDECGEDGRQYGNPFDAFDNVQRDDKHAPPQNNFAKIVGMSTHSPQACGEVGSSLSYLCRVNTEFKFESENTNKKSISILMSEILFSENVSNIHEIPLPSIP